MCIRMSSACRTLLLFACLGIGAPEPTWAGESDPGVEPQRVSMSELRDRASSMPIDQRLDIDKRIAATVERVNRDVASSGQTRIATKLAAQFGLTTDALFDVKSDWGFSWGELVVARTLLTDREGAVTLDDVGSLRAEGFTWGALAFGLGYHLEDLEDAIRAQGRIATGLSKGGPAGK